MKLPSNVSPVDDFSLLLWGFWFTVLQAERVSTRSAKKISKKLSLLFACGLYTRVRYVPPGYHGGNVPFLYRVRVPGSSSSGGSRNRRHDFLVTEAIVHIAEWIRELAGYAVTFSPPGHFRLRSGLLPDATALITNADLVGCWCIELDLTHEPLTAERAYSLIGTKLAKYRDLFDQQCIGEDLRVPQVRDFRVVLILESSRRQAAIRELLRQDGLHFVLMTTLEEFLSARLHDPIWWTVDGMVDFFGRAKK